MVKTPEFTERQLVTKVCKEKKVRQLYLGKSYDGKN